MAEATALEDPAVLPTPEAHSLVFTGEEGPVFKLVLKNALLTLITVGIYRFWAKTWLRRYFWSNTRITDEPLEYTGTANELFVGFLIVIAVLFPFGVGYAILEMLAMSSGPIAQGALDAGYLVALLLLIQAARFRMWRYRLSRTTWRGIRFGLDGSTWRFLVLSVGWFALTALTLGLAYPWMRVALIRYRLQNVRFGNTRFAFEGSGRGLFKEWGIGWAFLVVPIAAFFALNADIMLAGGGAAGEGAATGSEVAGTTEATGIVLAAPYLLLAPLVWLPLYVWYRVCEFRYVVGCTRIGEALFRSGVRTGRLMGLLTLSILAFVVLIGGLLGFVIAVLTLPQAANQATNLIMFFAVAVFLLVLGPVVTYCILILGMIRHIYETLTIANPQAFDRVLQSTERGPEFGEGLADAFDVGAI